MEGKFDAVTLGEVMLRLSPPSGGRLQVGPTLERYVAGAELNVAAGMAQLGLKTAVCTKLPDNPLSRFALSEARAWGVSDEAVVWDTHPDARLGLYYFESASAPRKPAAYYDRKGSSINTLRPDEVPGHIYGKARLFHTSGITLGLGEQTRTTAAALMRAFHEAGALLSFDVNYRANLWTDQEERAAVEPLLPLLDVLFVSEESLRRMFGRTGALEDILPAFAAEYGISQIFSTQRTVLSPSLHTFTALGYDAATGQLYTEEPYEIQVVDRVGSGDAFVAGALYGLLRHNDSAAAIRYGNAMAAAKCTVMGDMFCTTRREIDSLIKAHHSDGPQSEMDR